jgi:mannosyltransferase
VQSFWADEALTANAVAGGFGDIWGALDRHAEATPPLYFYATWLWSQLFGSGDGALRSLSAAAGLLTVPAVFALGRRAVSERAGLVAAALVAASPFLVWYSQEARAYALAGLFTGLVLLFYALARDRPSPRHLAGWALCSVLALCSHYFTFFVVIPAALLLVARERGRATLVATGATLLCAAALVVRAQSQSDLTSWIELQPFSDRVEGVVKALVSGPSGAPGQFLGLIAGVVLTAGLGLGVRAALRRPWGLLTELLVVAGAAVLAPFALWIVGADYVFYRYFVFAWLPLAVVVGAGLSSLRGPYPLAAVAVVLAAFVAIDVGIALDEDHQREDWKSLARDLGTPEGARVVIVSPGTVSAPLQHYGHPIRRLDAAELRPTEIAVVGQLPAGWDPPRLPSASSFVQVEDRGYRNLRLVRFRAPRPERLLPVEFAPSRIGRLPGPYIGYDARAWR